MLCASPVDDHENMTFLTRTQACKGVDRALFNSNIPQKEEKKQGIEGTIVKSCKEILSNILLPSLVFVRFKGIYYCKKTVSLCVSPAIGKAEEPFCHIGTSNPLSSYANVYKILFECISPTVKKMRGLGVVLLGSNTFCSGSSEATKRSNTLNPQ